MQTLKYCWKMVDILILIAFYGTIVVILASGQPMSVSPHRARKHNTPLSNEEQVWDMRGIGIREPEKDLKWRMQFLLHFGDSFKAMSPSLDPGTVWGNSAELRQTRGLWKRNAPTGRAAPPRTSPESASNFRGIMKPFSKIIQKTLPFAF